MRGSKVGFNAFFTSQQISRRFGKSFSFFALTSLVETRVSNKWSFGKQDAFLDTRPRDPLHVQQ